MGDERWDDNNTCFVKGYGTIVKRTLHPEEVLRVTSGSLLVMTSTIRYDVTTMSGVKNVLFGGTGLFVTTLTGPGTVWLQGTSIAGMVSELQDVFPVVEVGLVLVYLLWVVAEVMVATSLMVVVKI